MFDIKPPVNDLTCRCALPETDPLENYKGKWAICYVLDNGSTVLTSKEKWKDTEQEKLDDIEILKSECLEKNKRNITVTIRDKAAHMFNNPEHKLHAKSCGYPVVISMFPIPVGEN